jgi:drug/metabolite transporter (DMT)-like permease
VWQVPCLRSITILSGFALAGRWDVYRDAIRSPIIKPMAFRSLVILGAWICYYTAAADLQLAELTTLYFAAPIITTLLSIPLLGEKVTPLRWFAVLTGFAGVLVASNPAQLGFSVPVILVLMAAGFWAYSIVLLRQIALSSPTSIQMVLNNLFFLIILTVPMIVTWVTPTWEQAALLLGAGVLAGVGQFTLFEGMKRAPASVAACFEYSALLWSFLLGYLIWRDVPRPEVFLGALLIVVAGIVIVFGETRRRRA